MQQTIITIRSNKADTLAGRTILIIRSIQTASSYLLVHSLNNSVWFAETSISQSEIEIINNKIWLDLIGFFFYTIPIFG